jgi:hypothetical protein
VGHLGVTVDGVEVERLIGEAIERVLGEHGEYAAKWVAIVETVGTADGERGLWAFTSENLKAWDTLGLLGHALERQRANIYNHRQEEE